MNISCRAEDGGGFERPCGDARVGQGLARIMIGDKNADLSSLPREWAEAVERAMA